MFGKDSVKFFGPQNIANLYSPSQAPDARKKAYLVLDR